MVRINPSVLVLFGARAALYGNVWERRRLMADGRLLGIATTVNTYIIAIVLCRGLPIAMESSVLL